MANAADELRQRKAAASRGQRVNQRNVRRLQIEVGGAGQRGPARRGDAAGHRAGAAAGAGAGRVRLDDPFVHLLHGQVQRDDLVVDQQLQAAVVLQQRHQLALLADLVLDVAHQRAHARVLAAVRVAQHPPLQKVLLLGVLLQADEELVGVLLLGVDNGAEALKDEHRRALVLDGALAHRLDAHLHKVDRLHARARGEQLQQLQQRRLRLVNHLRPLDDEHPQREVAVKDDAHHGRLVHPPNAVVHHEDLQQLHQLAEGKALAKVGAQRRLLQCLQAGNLLGDQPAEVLQQAGQGEVVPPVEAVAALEEHLRLSTCTLFAGSSGFCRRHHRAKLAKDDGAVEVVVLEAGLAAHRAQVVEEGGEQVHQDALLVGEPLKERHQQLPTGDAERLRGGVEEHLADPAGAGDAHRKGLALQVAKPPTRPQVLPPGKVLVRQKVLILGWSVVGRGGRGCGGLLIRS